MTSDDDFESRPRRSGCLKHVDVAALEDGVTDSHSLALEARQVFYFSKQMFEYMCEHGTAERISQEAERIASVRKGVLLKRQEAHSRSEKLRDFVSEQGLQKPSGSEVAQLRRKKHARKKNTDQIMGRNPDQVKRRRFDTEHSEASQQLEELSQLSECPSQQQLGTKRPRTLWGKHSVPFFNPEPSAESNFDDCKRSAVGALAKQLAIDFNCSCEETFVAINDAFRLPHTNYELHGHFLSACIVFCTQKKTGHAFVRASVDHQKQSVVLKCKLSSNLTGRATQRKKAKIEDYSSQAAAMHADVQAKENSLWHGTQRTSFTKRISNCKCALRLHYVGTFKEWKATLTCNYHNHHSENVLPPPLLVPKNLIDILQGLRSNLNATMKQQLQLCAENGLPVTHELIRKINASAAADPTFGLSGDSGFLFTLIGSGQNLTFVAEFELVDECRKVQQRVTVARVGGKYLHIRGGKMSTDPTMEYEGLDARTSDANLRTFHEFLHPLLVRKPLKVCIKNCVWRTCDDLKLMSAHPNVIMFDTTCKTNVKNKHFGYGSGRTMNHNWFKGFSFFLDSLQTRDFHWLWAIALPAIIDESVRRRLQVVVTDGDSNMIDAITGAVASVDSNGQLIWGLEQRGVKMRRCIFHLLHLNFESQYKMFNSDGGVGVKVRDWLKKAGQNAERKEDAMRAIQEILQWIRKEEGPQFSESARELLLEWVTARLMHIDEWARYSFNHLTSFDIETTSPSEGAHSGLKMDTQVHSKSELAHLLLADIRRTQQSYFELQRDSEVRNLEEATNVRTVVEQMLHKNFVLHTCNDVIKEFIQSMHYGIFKRRDDDDEDVVALVCRKTNEADTSFCPFKFSRIRVIRKYHDRLLCSCSATTVHKRPCRHLVAYNRGVIDCTDFAEFHTKKYHAHPHALSAYIGVGNRRTQEELLQLQELPTELSNDPQFDAADDGEQTGPNDGNSKKTRRVRGYHSCSEEFKRVLVKWGNVPRILQKFKDLVRNYDTSLGDIDQYNRCGHGSSKPTPQASRSKRK
jgi:hypothetical protein